MYLTVKECDKQFEIDPLFCDEWSNLTEAKKVNLITYSSDLIDHRAMWCGQPIATHQTFQFPRDFSACWEYEDIKDIYFRSHNIIPEEVKKATLLVIKEVHNAQDHLSKLQKNNVKSFSDGDMSVSFGDNTVTTPGNKNKRVFNLLYPFTIFGWSMSTTQ